MIYSLKTIPSILFGPFSLYDISCMSYFLDRHVFKHVLLFNLFTEMSQCICPFFTGTGAGTVTFPFGAFIK